MEGKNGQNCRIISLKISTYLSSNNAKITKTLHISNNSSNKIAIKHLIIYKAGQRCKEVNYYLQILLFKILEDNFLNHHPLKNNLIFFIRALQCWALEEIKKEIFNLKMITAISTLNNFNCNNNNNNNN